MIAEIQFRKKLKIMAQLLTFWKIISKKCSQRAKR